MKPTKYFLSEANYGRGVDVHICKINHAGDMTHEAKPLDFTCLEDPNVSAGPPAFTMHKWDAQQMMDELYRIGYRPTDGKETAGQLVATERHLNDMRALVAAGNKVELPNAK